MLKVVLETTHLCKGVDFVVAMAAKCRPPYSLFTINGLLLNPLFAVTLYDRVERITFVVFQSSTSKASAY